MIEKMILDYLTSNLSVPVFPERPENEPERYVLIEKTGSGKKDQINRATIALKTYAESMYEASCLNEIVKEKMEDKSTRLKKRKSKRRFIDDTK